MDDEENARRGVVGVAARGRRGEVGDGRRATGDGRRAADDGRRATAGGHLFPEKNDFGASEAHHRHYLLFQKFSDD